MEQQDHLSVSGQSCKEGRPHQTCSHCINVNIRLSGLKAKYALDRVKCNYATSYLYNYSWHGCKTDADDDDQACQ